MDDEDKLASSLTGLSGLLVGHRALEQTLVRVAEFAVQAVPGAQGAGLTLHEPGQQRTIVSTAEFVHTIDDIQYSLNEGPCVSAAAERRTVISGNLGGEPQWPRFGPRVGRLGVHSALSLPLLLPDRVLGAMNIYAREKNAFDAAAVRLGEAFAGPAAVSVSNAQMLAQAERLVQQLQEALTSRAQIDQALGVVMSRTGVSSAEALARLQSISQSRSVKLVEVARELLDQAVRSARARRAGHDAAAESATPPQ